MQGGQGWRDAWHSSTGLSVNWACSAWSSGHDFKMLLFTYTYRHVPTCCTIEHALGSLSGCSTSGLHASKLPQNLHKPNCSWGWNPMKKTKPTYTICKYHYQCLIIFFLSAPLYHCQFLWKGSHRKPIETQSMRKSCTVFSSHKDLRTASTCRKSRKWNSSPSQWQLRKSNCLPWLGKGEARTYSHNFS